MARHAPVWATAALSFFGEGIYRSAIPIIAITFDNDPSNAGVSIAAAKLPWLSASILVGTAIDRYASTIVMRAGTLIRLSGLLALAYLIGSDAFTLGAFLVISFTVATGDVTAEVAIQTSVPEFASNAELPKTNARLHGIQMLAGQLVAPPIAGALLAFGLKFLVAFVVLIQCAAAICSLFCRQTVCKPPIEATSSDSPVRQVLSDRTLIGIFALGSVMMGAYGAWSAVFALFVIDTDQGLGMTTTQYGITVSSIAVGALAGSIVIPRIRAHVGDFNLICFASVALVALTTICLLTASKLLVLSALLLYGISLSAWNVTAISYRQRTVPSQMLGRVTGMYRTFSWGAMPLGALVGAGVTSKYGYPAAFGIAAVISGMQLLVLPLLMKMRRFQA